MNNDPIIEELRRVREELAAQFNFDIYAIGADLQARQAKEARRIVSFARPGKEEEKDELEVQDLAA